MKTGQQEEASMNRRQRETWVERRHISSQACPPLVKEGEEAIAVEVLIAMVVSGAPSLVLTL
jgi:hypothetical protein